jgi:hypothetical protein
MDIAKFLVRVVVAALAALASLAGVVVLAPPRAAEATTCGGRDAAALDAVFQAHPGRVAGADYLRAYALPNGTTLVLLQDVFLGPEDGEPLRSLWAADFLHNAGVLLDQDGCVVRTLAGNGSYLGGDRTQPLSRWFWALAGAVGADDRLHVFVAEMVNPRHSGAGTGAEPVATWRATIDPVTLEVLAFEPAADASAALYGWAVASDATHTYLFGHCYRQFVPGEMFGHDAACTSQVTVGRVPLGQLGAAPEYHSATGWSSDPAAAVAVPFPGARMVNPVSVQHLAGRFVSVSKEGDWWGTTIYVDTAPAATGPWTTVATLTPENKCAECNTYFASLMPWRQADGALVVALSNNAWDMHGVAYEQPALYRNSFLAVTLPRTPAEQRRLDAAMAARNIV